MIANANTDTSVVARKSGHANISNSIVLGMHTQGSPQISTTQATFEEWLSRMKKYVSIIQRLGKENKKKALLKQSISLLIKIPA